MKSQGAFYRFLNGKGFYVALGVCMVAIGISAWVATGALSKTETAKKQQSRVVESASSNNSTIATERKESGVPKSSQNLSSAAQSSKASSATAASSSQKPTAKYFVYPLTGEIIKDFNKEQLQYSVTYNDMRIHNGLDIAAKEGTAVKAAGDGTVTEVKKDASLGHTVKIDHGNNISVVYAGLKEKINVKKGDAVTAGTVLGALGTVTCESLDAPHLHLEFYDGKAAVSPLEMLEKAAAQN